MPTKDRALSGTVSLPVSMWQWLRAHPDGVSGVVKKALTPAFKKHQKALQSDK